MNDYKTAQLLQEDMRGGFRQWDFSKRDFWHPHLDIGSSNSNSSK